MAKTKLSQGAIKKLIASFVKDLEFHKIKVDKIVLYGSYASGRPGEFSDVDIAVISPSFKRKTILKIQEELALAAGRYLSIIEPIGFSPEEFDHAGKTTFPGEVKRTGKIMYSAA